MKLLNYKTNIKQALNIAPVLFLCTTLLISSLFWGACKRVEDSSYFKEEINQYELNNYVGETEFSLANDTSYPVYPSDIEFLSLQSKGKNEESNTIKALYIGNLATVSTDTIFLVCHDYNNHNDYYFNKAKIIFNSGKSIHKGVLMIDYQGFGLSEGEQRLSQITNDIKAGIEWLQKRGVTSSNFVMYGHGFGAIPACELSIFNAADSLITPGKLILENPVGHSDLAVSSALQINIPSSYLGNYTFDNFNKIKEYGADLLVLISEKDEKFNPDINGQKLYDFHNGSFKSIKKIKDATHRNIIPLLTYKEFVSLIENFIRR